MDNKDVFAANLNRLMAAQGKTRRDISDALGVSYYTVTSWANGSKHPRMERLQAIADYFGVSLAELIEDNDIPAVTPVKTESATIGDFFRALRVKNRLSLMECSAEFGIPVDTLREYESGRKQMTFSEIINVARFYSLDPEGIFEALLHIYPGDDVLHSIRYQYVENIRAWHEAFGNAVFEQAELSQLIKFGKYLLWQRDNRNGSDN